MRGEPGRALFLVYSKTHLGDLGEPLADDTTDAEAATLRAEGHLVHQLPSTPLEAWGAAELLGTLSRCGEWVA